MRGLDLSRLAARGRASESVFFKDRQAEQATKLRSKLSVSELASAKSQHPTLPSVDTLSEISAQRTYRTLLKRPRTPPTPLPPRPLLSRLARLNPSSYAGLAANNPASSAPADPKLLRALGSGKLNLYTSLPVHSAAPLPGAERYAEGAVLGIASFGIATAIVASVGLVGGLYIYLNPSIVDAMRERSVRFGRTVDGSLGARLRRFRDRMQSRGSILSANISSRARDVATGVVKLPTPEDSPPRKSDDSPQAAVDGEEKTT